MKIKKRYIIFIVGLSLFLFSFFWFAFRTDIYLLFLVTGMLTSVIFYFYIVVKRDTSRNKLICTGLVLGTIFIVTISARRFIDWSYLMYTSYNQKHLNRANHILQNKNGVIVLSGYGISGNVGQLDESEIDELEKLMEELGIDFVRKGDNSIYYGTSGLRNGIRYIIDEVKQESSKRSFTKIKSNWYY